MKRRILNLSKNFLKITAPLLLVLVTGGNLFAQYKGDPVKKEKLLTVLRSKQLQTREIVGVIKSNGVDFQVTSAVESELVSAGARPEVIAAAKDNYRQTTIARNIPTTPTTPKKTKFSGEPLTRDSIITLLQNGVADAQVRKNVEGRGVNFLATPQIKEEIRKAGGSVALVNLVAASYNNPNQNAAGNNIANETDNVSNRYEDLINKSVDLYDNQKNPTAAIDTLKEAIKIAPNESRAYQLAGYAALYGLKNFDGAESYMREAINRGGSAVFRVFHDHNGTFTDFCQGSLYIAKDGVRFEGDDNKHTFETTDANIKQVKMNNSFRRLFQTKAGSFKIVLRSGDDDSVKFSFAPLTDNELESRMIIRLIGKN